MTLTTNQLDAIWKYCAGIVAQGGKWLVRDKIKAIDIVTLVATYKNAQKVRRQGLYALLGNDKEMCRNLLRQLPESDEDGPLWNEKR